MRETADQVDIVGKKRSDAVVMISVSGGVVPENAGFTLEIRGSEGWLRLVSDHPYGSQAGNLKLTSNIPFVIPDEPTVSDGHMSAAINVGEVYVQLVRDLREGTYTTPDFEHALHHARLIDAIRSASEQSERPDVLQQVETFDENEGDNPRERIQGGISPRWA